MHGHGEIQKLRTDFEARLLAQPGVDCEVDLVALDNEIDDAAGSRKRGRFADGEDALRLERAAHRGHPRFLTGAREEDVNGGRFGFSGNNSDLDRSVINFPVLDDRFQFIAEWIGAEDPDHDGALGRGEATRRPFHKLREIVKKGRFYLVFARNGCPFACLRSENKEGLRKTESRQESEDSSLAHCSGGVRFRLIAQGDAGYYFLRHLDEKRRDLACEFQVPRVADVMAPDPNLERPIQVPDYPEVEAD